MDEYGEYIISAADLGQVVAEPCRVDSSASARQQIDDVISQTLIVHINIVGHGIVGTRTSPIVVAPLFADGSHNTIGVEHRQLRTYLIAVIPCFQFIVIHAMTFRQHLHLILGESEIAGHGAGLHHGIFLKIVERRLGLVLLDGQDAGHIHSRKHLRGRLAFEKPAQPVHISVCHCLVFIVRHVPAFAQDGIPLVDDEDEPVASLKTDADKVLHQVIIFAHSHTGINDVHIPDDFGVQIVKHSLVLMLADEESYVNGNDRILVQMLLKRRMVSNLQVGEQAARVA